MNIVIGKRSFLSRSKKFDENKFLKLDKDNIIDNNLIKKLRNKEIKYNNQSFLPFFKIEQRYKYF